MRGLGGLWVRQPLSPPHRALQFATHGLPTLTLPVQLRKATRAHVCCVPGCGKRLASASSLRNHAKTHLKRLKMMPTPTAAAVEG